MGHLWVLLWPKQEGAADPSRRNLAILKLFRWSHAILKPDSGSLNQRGTGCVQFRPNPLDFGPNKQKSYSVGREVSRLRYCSMQNWHRHILEASRRRRASLDPP